MKLHALASMALLVPTALALSKDRVQNPDLNLAYDIQLSPRQDTYAPFSGALYIVYPNGQSVNTASTNMCPSYASVSCSNIGQPSWCCPTSYTCAAPSNSGLIGCCPPNTSCSGPVAAESVTTITVQNVVVATQNPVYQSTSYVYVNAYTTTAPAAVVYNGYCSTLTMDGPGLPTTRQGDCGTILVVNGGQVVGVSLGILGSVVAGVGWFLGARLWV